MCQKVLVLSVSIYGELTAALEVEDINANLPYTGLHELSTQGETQITTGQPVTIHGFPGQLAKHYEHKKTGRRGLSAFPHVTIQTVKDLSFAPREKDPNINFITDFDYATEEQLDPHGMSGCGAWSIPTANKEEIWSAGKTQLLGIQVAYDRPAGVLVFVRIDRVLRLLTVEGNGVSGGRNRDILNFPARGNPAHSSPPPHRPSQTPIDQSGLKKSNVPAFSLLPCHDAGGCMQSVKLLLLVLLTFALLSCETKKTEIITTGNGTASLCGDTLVGVTTEKREFEVAGATLKDFSLGKLNTNVTPEFQKIASEAALHEDSRVKIACRAMEMSGVKASPEMFTYYLQLLGFLSSSPSAEKRMEWAEKFPVPKIPPLPAPNSTNPGAHGSVQGPQESLSERLIRTCNQPVDGLNRQPQEFVPIWLGPLRQLHHEKFPAQRDLQTLYNIKSHLRDRYNTPEDFFRESLYTLKCLIDAGEIIRLETTGTPGKIGDKVFENQRIIFP